MKYLKLGALLLVALVIGGLTTSYAFAANTDSNWSRSGMHSEEFSERSDRHMSGERTTREESRTDNHMRNNDTQRRNTHPMTNQTPSSHCHGNY